jgi:hypothetical protein
MDNINQRISVACKTGKSASAGGLNVPDIKKLLKTYGIEMTGDRKALLEALCAHVSKPKPHIKPGKQQPSLPGPGPPPRRPVTRCMVEGSANPQYTPPSGPVSTKCVPGPAGSGTGCGSVAMGDYCCLFDNGPNPNISKFMVESGLSQTYDHTTYEQGTGGDCLYCCLAAGINEINRKLGKPDRVSMANIRDIVADSITTLDPDLVMVALMQDGIDPAFDGTDANKLATHIRATVGRRKEGTEFDLNVFLKEYPDIGVIVSNAQSGQIYCTNSDINTRRKHYILILWDYAKRVGNKMDDGSDFKPDDMPNHYRVLGLRNKTSPNSRFEYVYRCDELPVFLARAVAAACPGFRCA